MVTVRNTKDSFAELDPRDVVGIFANGQRSHALRIDGERRIMGESSVLLYFGFNKFPLVKLATRD